MERKVIEFDAAHFFATSFDWQIDWRGQAGQAGVTGSGQVVYGSQPRWIAQLDFATLRRDQIRSWRGIINQLRGRYNVLRVRLHDPLQPSWQEIGSPYRGRPVPHSDGSYFSDGSGYSQGMTAPVLETAPAGATSLRIDANYLGNFISAGHKFSVNDWLYEAVGIEGQGENAVLHFEMPLRRPVFAEEEINLNATCLVALEGDLTGALRVEPGDIGAPSLSLVEWVGPGRS
ncbi:hypothetical protein [Devosia sp. MC1541]|uniref:hypothetical protein n=1 Tax=Devosia sp. MC1541 TaxID=2725264 RepID=UPI00145F9048|nr:hypothetical protein [Devosia sp. MC1541]